MPKPYGTVAARLTAAASWLGVLVGIAGAIGWYTTLDTESVLQWVDLYVYLFFVLMCLFYAFYFSKDGLRSATPWARVIAVAWLAVLIAGVTEIRHPNLHDLAFWWYGAFLLGPTVAVWGEYGKALDWIAKRLSGFDAFQREEKTGWVHIAVLLGLLGVITVIQLLSIYDVSIGTDEGNAPYVVKMLQDGLTMYRDFWSREPLSTLMFYPFASITGQMFLSLRIYVIGLQLALLLVTYAFVRRLFSPNAALLSVALFIGFHFIFLRINWGLFNLTWFPMLVTIAGATIALVVAKSQRWWHYALLGLFVGASILVYKASQALLLLVPLAYFLEFKRIDRQMLVYLGASFIPISIFWVVFGVGSSFEHVYVLILEKVIWLYGALAVLFVFGALGLPRLSKLRPIDWLLRRNWFELLPIALIYCFLGIVLFRFLTTGEVYNLWPLLIESSFVFISIFLLNFLAGARYHRMVGNGVLFLYIFLIFGVIIQHFGKTGKILEVDFMVHAVIAGCLLLSIFLTIPLARKMETVAMDKKTSLILLISNAFFVAMVVGANYSTTRFKYILYLFPFIALSLLWIIRKQRIEVRAGIIAVILVGVAVANVVNHTYPDEYSLYPYKNIERVLERVELGPEDTIFTGDLLLASSIPNENLLKVNSPWMYRRDRPYLFYWDPSLDPFGGYMHYGAQDYAALITERKPKYILGSARVTNRTFFKTTTNPRNEAMIAVRDEEYTFVEKVGSIRVYQRTDTLKLPSTSVPPSSGSPEE